MCSDCRNQRKIALTGDEENGDLFPPCACEWFVISAKDFQCSENLGDILEAAGYNVVTKKPPKGSASNESEKG
jgi:hypothetical protein